MKEQFQHKITNSFILWFDNFLLTKGEAFSNKTGTLFNYTDNRLDSRFTPYGSAYKQWVTDSSVTGATIPSGVFIDGNFSGRDDGVVLDFDNGRALISGDVTTSTVTGEFAVKDFNIYLTNDTEDDIIVENKYVVNSRIPSITETNITPYDDVVPAIFISTTRGENAPYALGGLQNSKINVNAVVLAEDTYGLDGVLSIFMDSVDECFAELPMKEYPVTELGDLKDNTYNYTGTAAGFDGNLKFYVDRVTTSKLTDRERNILANELYVGFIDFDINMARTRFS
tara:strand:- start:285 stop:1133 length:849 start_codon:yes stop_codon:yes gene_type:complete